MTRFTALALFVAVLTTACAKPTPPPDAAEAAAKPPDPAMLVKAGYDDTRDPAKDLAALIPEARTGHKRILIVVGGEWCVWCHYLHNFLEKETDIKTLWDDRFVTLHVSYDSEGNKNEPFLSQYPKIPGYPHIFVLDENGAFIHSHGTDVLESGRGYSKDAVRAFLETWKGN